MQIGLLALATYAILSAAGGVDWDEFTTTVRVRVRCLGRVSGSSSRSCRGSPRALSTLGSVPAELPFGPVYTMQLATGYMNLALPSNLARMAVEHPFLPASGPFRPDRRGRRDDRLVCQHRDPGDLLGVLLIFSESSLAFDLPFPSGGMRTLLWIVDRPGDSRRRGPLSSVRRIRRTISENVRRWWPDVRAALATLRSTRKLALLVLGSLATELLFAIALGLFARSFGYDISIAELLVINISVSLLGTLVPVPGNIGVAEFGLAIGLVAAGMTDESALAAVLLYRISTFYLPPVWGFFAMLWLQRNRYL